MFQYICTYLLFFFCFFGSLEATSLYLELEGHLDAEKMGAAKKQLEKKIDQKVEEIVIELKSSSGEMDAVLSFVKEVYAYRVEHGLPVIVYINDAALGPAAMIPFLADKLYVSYFVNWGDIPFETETSVQKNLLRNSLRSVIPLDHPKRVLLSLFAVAMIDASLQVIDDGGWRLGAEESGIVISPKGETLVVNHQQLQYLGIVQNLLPLREFQERYLPEKEKEQEGVVSPLHKSLEERLEAHIPYSTVEKNLIGLIKIDNKKSQISQATWIYVKNALDYYAKKKPAFIILELNTPGGEVFSAQKISDALKKFDTQYDIPVIAFINNWAISAGAMLAYSCRFITVTKDGSMGAAEPVLAGEGGKMVTASEKVNSALRADFSNRASFFDRNPFIAEAMVDKEIILVERHGKIIKVGSEKQVRKSDGVVSSKGKLLTLSAEEQIKFGVADLMLLPKKLSEITTAEKEKGEWSLTKTLLGQVPFFQKIPNATIDLYQMDWKTQFLVLLSNPVVSSLLFLGMLMGFYIEVNSPGVGLPGSVALLCLFLIGLSSFALEVANTLEIVLLAVGVLFVVLDLFLIPTFGLLGIVGVILFFVGLFGMMLPGIGSINFEFDTQTFNAAGEVFIQRLAWLCGTLVIGVLLMALMGKYVMPNFSGFRHLVLEGSEETADEGFIAGLDPKRLPQPGSKGEVVATLRPSGKVMIEGNIYDAVTEGEFIDQKESIVVSHLDGSVIVVDRKKEKL